MSAASGILYSTAAGAATGVGAAGVYFIRRLSPRLEDGLLSFAAGVMLSASFFSLIVPGLDAAAGLGYGKLTSVTVVVGGLMLGAIGVHLANRLVPHEHFVQGRQGPDPGRLARVWLFVMAITLHNLPEGMAVGVGASAGDGSAGLGLAFGIGVQNLPEGLAVAVSLLTLGYSRTVAFSVSLLTGLVEGLGGAFGALALTIAQPSMPWVFGMAAGAMLYVISHEVIPETHHRDHAAFATFSLMVGFCVMMVLDATLG